MTGIPQNQPLMDQRQTGVAGLQLLQPGASAASEAPVPRREGHLFAPSEDRSSRLPRRSKEKQTDTQGSHAVGAGREADPSKRLPSLAQLQPEGRLLAIRSL